MNDEDRYRYVINDEGLYNRMIQGRRDGISATKWIRANRALIDEVIENVRTGRKSASYLAYPHDGTCQCYGCKQRRKANG